MGEGKLGDPKRLVRKGGRIFANVRGETAKVAIPMERDEVDCATFAEFEKAGKV